jgi:hypothetical protein
MPEGSARQASSGCAAGTAKAPVEGRQDVAEDGVGAVTVRHGADPQVRHQPVLEGAPDPLDAALRLGRAGGDRADAELRERAPDLGRPTPVGELLLEARGCRRCDEDRVAVVVHGDRPPVPADGVAQDLEVARRVLLVAERRGGQRARRIVDRTQEREPRAAPTEPVVAAPVELEQQARLGHPVAPTAVARPAPALARASDARRAQDAPHRDAAEPDAALGEQLDEMAVVRPGQLTPCERDHPLARRVGDPPRRRPSPVAMDDRRRAVLQEARLLPVHRPLVDAQQRRRLARADQARHQLREDEHPPLLFDSHRDRLPHPGRLTKSLISWR